MFVTAAKLTNVEAALEKQTNKKPKHFFEHLKSTEIYKAKHNVPLHQLPAPLGVIIYNILVHILSEKKIFKMTIL